MPSRPSQRSAGKAPRRGAGVRPQEDEQAFLAHYDASRFDHPSVTADVVLLTVREGALWSLLVRRLEHPDKGKWSLPGVFVGMREALDQAAARALREKARLEGVY